MISKQDLIAYGERESVKYNGVQAFAHGFTKAIELMWPLIEALDHYAKGGSVTLPEIKATDNMNFLNVTMQSFTGTARQALSDLEKRIGEE